MLALTVYTPYAVRIASGEKILELRTRQLLAVGQRVVICSSAPDSRTLCLVECLDVRHRHESVARCVPRRLHV